MLVSCLFLQKLMLLFGLNCPFTIGLLLIRPSNKLARLEVSIHNHGLSPPLLDSSLLTSSYSCTLFLKKMVHRRHLIELSIIISLPTVLMNSRSQLWAELTM
jgi:hypothetical protein